MPERVALVTGASSGIGRAAATELARRGWRVALHGHDPQRTQHAHDAARAAATGPPPTAYLQDLSLQDGVRRLAAAFRADHDRLDVLVNNAGVVLYGRRRTADGVETTLALDHLAPYLLTHELFHMLRASAPARVVTVSSSAHWGGHIRFDENGHVVPAHGWAAYAQAKLANILFTRELAARAAHVGVVAHAVHPGVVRTRFARGGPWWVRAGFLLGWPLLRSPRRGADTVVHVATSEDAAALSGVYWYDRRPVETSPAAHDHDLARRLWDASARMVSVDPAWPAAPPPTPTP